MSFDGQPNVPGDKKRVYLVDDAGFEMTAEYQGRDDQQVAAVIFDNADGFPFFPQIEQIVHLDRGAVYDRVLACGKPGILLGSLPDFVPDNLRVYKDLCAAGNGSGVEKTPYQCQS